MQTKSGGPPVARRSEAGRDDEGGLPPHPIRERQTGQPVPVFSPRQPLPRTRQSPTASAFGRSCRPSRPSHMRPRLVHMRRWQPPQWWRPARWRPSAPWWRASQTAAAAAAAAAVARAASAAERQTVARTASGVPVKDLRRPGAVGSTSASLRRSSTVDFSSRSAAADVSRRCRRRRRRHHHHEAARRPALWRVAPTCEARRASPPSTTGAAADSPIAHGRRVQLVGRGVCRDVRAARPPALVFWLLCHGRGAAQCRPAPDPRWTTPLHSLRRRSASQRVTDVPPTLEGYSHTPAGLGGRTLFRPRRRRAETKLLPFTFPSQGIRSNWGVSRYRRLWVQDHGLSHAGPLTTRANQL